MGMPHSDFQSLTPLTWWFIFFLVLLLTGWMFVVWIQADAARPWLSQPSVASASKCPWLLHPAWISTIQNDAANTDFLNNHMFQCLSVLIVPHLLCEQLQHVDPAASAAPTATVLTVVATSESSTLPWPWPHVTDGLGIGWKRELYSKLAWLSLYMQILERETGERRKKIESWHEDCPCHDHVNNKVTWENEWWWGLIWLQPQLDGGWSCCIFLSYELDIVWSTVITGASLSIWYVFHNSRIKNFLDGSRT
jgi:hypothetical protein